MAIMSASSSEPSGSAGQAHLGAARPGGSMQCAWGEHVALGQDPWCGVWYVSHGVTGERSAIEDAGGAPWCLDADGGASEPPIIYSGDGAVVHCSEDLLRWRAALDNDGQWWVWRAEDGSETAGALSWLRQVCEHFELEPMIAGTGASVKLRFAKFAWSRSGCCCFWDLLNVCSAAGFKTPKGQRSRWVQKHWASWARSLAGFGLDDHLLRSQQYAVKGEPSEDRDADRSLSFPASSSAAWFMIMCRCAFSPSHAGGLEQIEDRQRARLLLEACLLAVADASMEICFFLGPGGSWHWPAMPKGDRPRSLQTGSGGQVKLESVRVALADMGELVGPLLVELQGAASDGDHCAVVVLLEALHRQPPLGVIGQQVAMSLGFAFDRVVQRSCDDQDAGIGSSILLHSTACEMDSDFKLDQLLARYYEETRRVARTEPLHLSFACDKSRVSSLGVMNMAIAIPSNRAWWAPPQARFFGWALDILDDVAMLVDSNTWVRTPPPGGFTLSVSYTCCVFFTVNFFTLQFGPPAELAGGSDFGGCLGWFPTSVFYGKLFCGLRETFPGHFFGVYGKPSPP